MKGIAAILTIFALAEAVEASPTACCSTLKKEIGDQLAYPWQPVYDLIESSYDTLGEAELKPACVFQPSNAQDLSHAVTILTSVNDHSCQFAIKNGGHNANPGFANIDGGVTVDLTLLSTVEYRVEENLARIGAGGKWKDVYKALETAGVTVAGGRNGNVGVGGLLTGGGISHFSPAVGWACDSIVNFEVILGDGSIVNANKTTNSDLFLALKGGGNNFGIVTRFDATALSQGNISSTLLISDASQIAAMFRYFTDITTEANFDTRTSLVMTPIYNSTTRDWKILNIAVYTEPLENPPVFADLFDLPSISRQTTIGSVASISNETQRSASNSISASLTFKPSCRLMVEMFDLLDDFFMSFTPPTGSVEWVLGFEPLVAGLVNPVQNNQTNVLGLDSSNVGYVLLLSPTWSDSESSDAVIQATKKAVSLLADHAKRKDMLQRFEYLNYAAPFQNPLESYGRDQLDFLRKVREKYDPRGVFQHQVPGGFKLHI